MESYLKKYNVTQESLLTKSSLPIVSNFSNGLAIELYNFAIQNSLIIKNYYYDWVSSLIGINSIEINKDATFSKVHRVLKEAKTKRGVSKTNYLDKKFEIPTQTCASFSESELTVLSCKKQKITHEQSLLAKVKVKSETISEVRDKSKQYKRKLDRLQKKFGEKKGRIEILENENKQLKRNVKCYEKTIKQKNLKISIQLVKNLKYQQLLRNLKIHETQLKKTNKQNECKMTVLRDTIECNEQHLASAKEYKTELQDARLTIDYMQALLNDSPHMQLYDETSNKYTNDTIMCVMNLTDMKVPVERVGSVIKEVAKLCGKTVDRTPAATTVNRIVDSKLAVSQKQIGSVLKQKDNTTLYTDETRKYGKCMQAYIVTDEDQTSYILGLREMVDKSGQSTLDTLKDILSDITCYCHEQNNDKNIGYTILCNIRDTMSDRASTEKRFNYLLEQFRNEILPQIIDNWENLSEDEKKLCSKMNNFYCGLHLLVGMADTCETTLKKFEKNYLDGKDIGSAAKPELKRYHKSESGTLRLIRTSSKSFAVGQDEKNGVSLPWTTYLKSNHEKNYIIRFKHNRFNLVFSLALAVYFHHHRISEFLDTIHGTSNDLLKAVTLDIKENLLLAGLKAFGLISKLVTGPLWKLLEAPGHILEINIYYKQLVDFLTKGANDIHLIGQFIRGDASPFNTVIREDDESKLLMEDNEPLNEMLFPMLQALFLCMSVLLNRMVADHLPGGQFYNPSEHVMADTKSAMKHNKLPEFVFGQLDQLLRYRPNASLLTNESYLIYSHNKTSEWLSALSDEDRHKLLNKARKEGSSIRSQFKVRLREIETKRIEMQEQRRIKLEETEKKRVQEMEKMTNEVCFHGLLQSEPQVNECLQRLPNDNERKEALKSQLRFRKNVLKQKHRDRKIYNFSRKGPDGKYSSLLVEELKQNVITLIQDCLHEPTAERKQNDIPMLVGKNVKHKFSDGIEYKGYVISVVPGFSDWYNIKYEGDIAIYAFNLCEDYTEGDLQLLVGN